MKTKLAFSSALALAIAGIASAGEITGTVGYRERIALPPNSIITVRLEDATRADAPAGLISESKFVSGRNQVPFSFKLAYVDSAIQPNLRYFVRATIHSDGELIYTSTDAYPVINNGTKKVDVLLKKVQAPPASLFGVRWKLTEIAGKPAKGNNRGGPFIEFDEKKGEITSNTGVNGMGGTFTRSDASLKIKPGAQTLMAGTPDMMDQERAFVDLLKKVSRFKVTQNGLELMQGNRVLAKFTRA